MIYLTTSVLLGLSSLVNTLTFKEIIDSANNEATVLGLSMFGVITIRLIYELVKQVIEAVSNYCAVLLDTRQVIFMHRAFVDKVATLDISTYENPLNVGLMNRAYGRLQYQMKLYMRSITEIVSLSLEISVSIGIFVLASPTLAVILLLANIIPIIVRSIYSNGVFMIYRADDETRRRFGYTSDILLVRETLPEIKIYHAFDFFKRRLTHIFTSFTSRQLKVEEKFQFFNTFAEFVPIFAVFAFSMLISSRLSDRTISTGTFVFLFTNVFVFASALSRLRQNVLHLYADGHFIDEIREFFDLTPNVIFPVLSKSPRSALIRKLEYPTFTFQNVSFRYPGTSAVVLHKINLTIPYGQNLALVGENGAGKTTLVKILLRMYDPTDGRILVNDVDLRKIPEDLLFDLFSTLFQSYGKFYLTVKENLELAAGRRLSDEEAEQYLKFSQAWEFVKSNEHGLHQQLGPEYKDGIDLSGGQWQKLAIARAFAKHAPMLILDEPTSAVDARSEMQIFDRLNRQMRGNTLLFISHRFSTIKDAERIVVLHQGRITEDGTHELLMSKRGRYHDLYSIQAQRYERNPPE